MKCLEAKNLFSDYLENELDLKVKQLLDAHLAICASCAKELAEFKGMLVSLKDTPEVEPPPYFLQAVHARLEKESAFNSLLKKLFVPFHIKVPLEAIALSVTVIIVVVLVQKSQIGKMLPVGLPVYNQYEPYPQRTATQEIRSIPRTAESTSDQLAFSEIHPREMANQIIGADWQSMSRQQQGLSVKEYSGAGAKLDSANTVLAEKAQSLDEEADSIKKEYWESKNEITAADMALKATPLQPLDLAKTKFVTTKEIILKTQQLDQDIPKLGVILQELGIVEIKTEHQPEKALFSFSIHANQLEVLLSRLKDWQIISLPTKDIAAKEETVPEPISVKLTLTTQ